MKSNSKKFKCFLIGVFQLMINFHPKFCIEFWLAERFFLRNYRISSEISVIFLEILFEGNTITAKLLLAVRSLLKKLETIF